MKTRRVGKVTVPLGERIRLGEGEVPLVHERFVSAEQLGAALRRRRRELGYTQQTAADLCNHSVRVISEIERGRPTAGIGVILDYALTLGVDMELSVRGRSS